MPNIPDVDIQIKGITKLLQELDSHKVTVPDSIPANLLKLYKLLLYLLLYLKLLLNRVNYQMTESLLIYNTNLQECEQKISSKLSTNFPYQHMLKNIKAHSSLIHLYTSRKT